MRIFLDDERNPNDWVGYDENWIVVRNFEEFKNVILQAYHDMVDIECISFDNDLGENQPEGYDCARWLTEEYIVIPNVAVHTMNPPAALNIYYLMKNWQAFNGLPVSCHIVGLKRKE